MLEDDGPLSSASRSNKACLPLTDCSGLAAVRFLSVAYSTQQFEQIRKIRDSGMEIARIAHKLNMEACDLVRQYLYGPAR